MVYGVGWHALTRKRSFPGEHVLPQVAGGAREIAPGMGAWARPGVPAPGARRRPAALRAAGSALHG